MMNLVIICCSIVDDALTIFFMFIYTMFALYKFLSSFYLLKGKGKAFCAGGDVMRVVLVIQAGLYCFSISVVDFNIIACH